MEFEILDVNVAGKTNIRVVGVGGAGGNAVQHMIRRGVQGVEFICMNTDAGALQRSKAEVNLQLGETGLGAGARPEVGASSAQEAKTRIADALQGVSIPVFIKNPMHADLALWMGAIERIQNAGLKDIAAIHRGFATGAPTLYRNQPLWEMAIALKTEMPDLPIICDPSHIAGRRDLLAQVAQKAADLNMNGWMIESHCNPDAALSDSAQQVTPQALQDLFNQITIRDMADVHIQYCPEMKQWRLDIDAIDEEIIQLLGRRMKMAETIGSYKKEKNLTIFSLQRWKEILESRQALGEKEGLTLRFLKTYLEALHAESIRHQVDVMK
jgi:chorismate mutase